MNELTTNNLVNGLVAGGESWGSEGASQDDVLVPRLMLMQDLSELVKTGRAKAGDICHSGTGSVLIPKGQTGEIIPISTFREWVFFEPNNQGMFVPRKTNGRCLITAANENLPAEGVQNGVPYRAKKNINFFVLFVPLIDELPFLASFKKANIMVGKQLTTHFKTAQMKKQPPAATVFKLGSTQKTWDGYTFGVNTIEPSRPATEQELVIAHNWYQTFKTTEVKVDEENDGQFDQSSQTVPF
jgi:hypothetical protein